MCDNAESYNCRLICYPTGEQYTYYKKSITKGKKNESLTKSKSHENRESVKIEKDTSKEEHCVKVSLSSTKNRIYNIARSNIWDWFITLTFDRSITDSSDYDTVVNKLAKYLTNIQQRHCPNMKYLIVPELHKDGEHYHFHGLLSNVENMQFRFSGKYDKKGNPIFNILNWKLGFTTATRVTDTAKVSSYITKYVTKASEQYLKEKKRYYASRNVERSKPQYTFIDKEDFERTYSNDFNYIKTVNIPQAHQQVTYYEINY